MFTSLPTTTWALVDPLTLAARAGSTIAGTQILLLVEQSRPQAGKTYGLMGSDELYETDDENRKQFDDFVNVEPLLGSNQIKELNL